MNENIKKIARAYQEVTGIGLPFSGTDEAMLYALEQSFYDRNRELQMLRSRDAKVKQFMKDMI